MLIASAAPRPSRERTFAVLPSDRIKFDASCAKRIFDSFRHFAPPGFGPFVWWNRPYDYVDVMQSAVRQGWNDLEKWVHVALLLMAAFDSKAIACPLASRIT
jgi:hypothetical protein